ELGELYVTAEGDRIECIPNAADLAAPDRFAKPDREFLNDQTPPLRREKVAKLVEENDEIKKHQYQQKDADEVKDAQEYGHAGWHLAAGMRSCTGFSLERLIQVKDEAGFRIDAPG